MASAKKRRVVLANLPTGFPTSNLARKCALDLQVRIGIKKGLAALAQW
jgi:hypothetical protein